MKAVYEATYAVPELGIEVGDAVLVEPAHTETPLLVVKGFDRNRLPRILEHMDAFTLVSFEGPPASSPASLRRWLSVHARPSRGQMKLVR